MKAPIATRAAFAVATLLVLVGASELHPLRRGARWHVPPLLQSAAFAMAQRGLNEEDQAQLTAGYYQGILRRTALTSAREGRLTSRFSEADEWRESLALFPTLRLRGDFLFYEFVPGLAGSPGSGVDTINRFGMVDREYALEKPPRTWRAAFIGDSLVRGLGTATADRVESRLEAWADEPGRRGSFDRIELLNFGVDAYRFTQMLEVMRTKAEPFHPDAYVVGLTELCVTRGWCHHLARLVHERIDLVYPFLREVVADSGVTPDDTLMTFEARLDPRWESTLTAVLREMKAIAAERRAPLLVLLLPTVREAGLLRARFDALRGMLTREGIAFVDLLDAFDGRSDLDALRVSSFNQHPNAAGNRVLFERLTASVGASRELCRALLGRDVP